MPRTGLRLPDLSDDRWLAGWLALVPIDVVVVNLRVAPGAAPAWVRALHHLYDGAQLLALGLLASAMAHAWRRWGPSRPVWARVALAASALGVGGLFLNEDLSVLASRLAGAGPEGLARALLVAGIALLVPAAAAFGAALERRGLWGAGFAAGAALAAANHGVLENDYRGVHLLTAWIAATLIGASWPRTGAERVGSPRARELRLLAVGVATVGLVVPPSNDVAVDMARSTGTVVEPWLAATRAQSPTLRAVDLEARLRLHRPADIPPSKPALLPEGGIVVLVLADALRADVAHAPENAERFPNLTAIRRRSVAFTRARAVAPATAQSVSAIFTGRYYSQLYWSKKKDGASGYLYPHEDETPRFPELLAEAGVQTVTFAGLRGLVNAFGIVRGFEEETLINRGRGSPGARRVVPPALARLAKQGAAPAFFYLHLNDPHAPYNRGGTEGTPFERYLAEVEIIDEAMGLLLQTLDEHGLAKRTAVIFSSDHGEAFGEHGKQYHATTMYEEMLRVPLYVMVPGVAPRTVETPVSIIDLGPTVLDLMGHATPWFSMGESLVPFLRGETPELRRPLALESSRQMRALVFPDRIKIIHDRRRRTVQMFDLAKDPGELENLYDAESPDSVKRLAALKRFFEVHRIRREGYTVPYSR